MSIENNETTFRPKIVAVMQELIWQEAADFPIRQM